MGTDGPSSGDDAAVDDEDRVTARQVLCGHFGWTPGMTGTDLLKPAVTAIAQVIANARAAGRAAAFGECREIARNTGRASLADAEVCDEIADAIAARAGGTTT